MTAKHIITAALLAATLAPAAPAHAGIGDWLSKNFCQRCGGGSNSTGGPNWTPRTEADFARWNELTYTQRKAWKFNRSRYQRHIGGIVASDAIRWEQEALRGGNTPPPVGSYYYDTDGDLRWTSP